MFVFPRWIQKRRKEHQLIKETRQFIKEKEAHESERRIQREKRDDQQAQALLLTLYERQRAMDPLIAAQVYNNRSCLLSRLPEEILLCIVDCLCNDVVALHCL